MLLPAVLATGACAQFILAHRLQGTSRRRAVGWVLLLVLQATAAFASARWTPWLRLLATWAATFLGFKAMLLLSRPPASLAGLTPGRFAGWAVAWLGMDLEPWMRPRTPRWTAKAWRTLWAGVALLAIGLGVIAAFEWLPFPPSLRLLQGWGLMAGLLVATFFGGTRLLTGAWRALGRDVPQLFDQPFRARNLADWWGRRWNLSVHTVLLETVWKPLRHGLGPAGATDAVFLTSGLLHEFLISYPARGGYGLPFCYFLIQTIGLRLERSRRLRPLLRRSGVLASAWTLGMVLLPSPLLFHPPLVRALVGPWVP
ncbi:MAG TPA: membrane bound O-acyl transferase family-domain-containing protein [Myxococcaceae bacterium]|nr:membrane bound O-acyl transferase family-domain-containing protein [Myxococcaceae bacterium]